MLIDAVDRAPRAATTTTPSAPIAAKAHGGQPRITVRHRSDDMSDARLVRGTPNSGVRDADDAARNVQVTLDFYREVLGRNGLDGRGRGVDVEVGRQDLAGNAAWDGEQLLFGTGDETSRPMSGSLDIVGHEFTHGVVDRTARFDVDSDQGAALHESYGDVFGELVQAWHERPQDFDTVENARAHAWVTGEETTIGGPGITAFSDLEHPRSAAVVEQHAEHMREFRAGADPHETGGIPSKAAVESALRIGTGRMARVWYDALVNRLDERAQFSDAARATIESAQALYGRDAANSVRDAWAAVGL